MLLLQRDFQFHCEERTDGGISDDSDFLSFHGEGEAEKCASCLHFDCSISRPGLRRLLAPNEWTLKNSFGGNVLSDNLGARVTDAAGNDKDLIQFV